MRFWGTIDIETDPFMRVNKSKGVPGRMPKAFAAAVHFRSEDSETGKSSQTALLHNPECLKFIVAECCKPKYTKWIFYAHNGGKFDFNFLLDCILEVYDKDDIKLLTIGSRIVEIETPTCAFRDSYALMPKSLKSIVSARKKDIAIWKLEASSDCIAYHSSTGIETFRADLQARGIDPFTWAEISPRLFYKEEINAYLRQDVSGLADALELFFKLYGQEITLATTCYKILKKQFGMPAVRTRVKFDELMRRFYYGGRVQFFGLGEFGKRDGTKRYKMIDINSAFPWAMTQFHWFSGGEPMRCERPPTQNREQCFYEITCDSEGMLPYCQYKKVDGHLKRKGGLSYPVGKQLYFYVTGWEYIAALELKKISNVTIHSVWVPSELYNFSEYVNHFYEFKKTAEGEERNLVKFLLNMAYGKFALNCREFRDVKISFSGESPEPVKINLRNGHTKIIEWEKSYEDKTRGLVFWQMASNHKDAKKPLSFNNVATAASITGCVRAFLARSMAKCSDVLYCDTDSLLCADCSTLEMGEDLGQWKLEMECDYVGIAGRKLYAAHDYRGAPSELLPKADRWKEWKTASKGVRLPIEDLLAVCRGEEKTFGFDAPNFSPFSPPTFTTRRVNRDDKRKKNKTMDTNSSDNLCEKCGIGFILPSGVCDHCSQRPAIMITVNEITLYNLEKKNKDLRHALDDATRALKGVQKNVQLYCPEFKSTLTSDLVDRALNQIASLTP